MLVSDSVVVESEDVDVSVPVAEVLVVLVRDVVVRVVVSVLALEVLVFVNVVQKPHVLSHWPACLEGQPGQNMLAHTSMMHEVLAQVALQNVSPAMSMEWQYVSVVVPVAVDKVVVTLDPVVADNDVAEVPVDVVFVVVSVCVVVVVVAEVFVPVVTPAQMAQVVSQMCADSHVGQKSVSQAPWEVSTWQLGMQSSYLKQVVVDSDVAEVVIVVETETDRLVPVAVDVLLVLETVVPLVVLAVVVVDVMVSVVVLLEADVVDRLVAVRLVSLVCVLVFVRVVQKPHSLLHMPAPTPLQSGQKSVSHTLLSQLSPWQATRQRASSQMLTITHSVSDVNVMVVVKDSVRLLAVAVVVDVRECVTLVVTVVVLCVVVDAVVNEVLVSVMSVAQKPHVMSHICANGHVGQKSV
jgi:hypothetical protein